MNSSHKISINRYPHVMRKERKIEEMKRSNTTSSSKEKRVKKSKDISFDDILKIAKSGNEKEFEDLLTQGLISNINMRNVRGNTLLIALCKENNLKGVKLLLDHGADANVTGTLGIHAIRFACRNYKDSKKECTEIIKLLVSKGADVNAKSDLPTFMRGFKRGSALFEACMNRQLDLVSLLLELGASADDQNPLVEACAKGDLNLAQLLLPHVTDVNLRVGRHGSCLDVACKNGDDELVKLLLNHQPPRHFELETAFVRACEHGHISTLQLLIDHGADVNHIRYGTTPLTTACTYGQYSTAQFLLEQGAVVNVPNCNPLSAACISKRPELVDLLLQYGADINAETVDHFPGSRSYTALYRADSRKLGGMVKLLLERGADLYRADGVNLALSSYGLLTRDPEYIALANQYAERNKRANRELQPVLK